MRIKFKTNYLVTTILVSLLCFIPLNLYAATDYDARLRVYKLDKSKYEGVNPLDILQSWQDDYFLNGAEEYTSNTGLQPGDMVVVAESVKFTGTTPNASSIFLYYKFDTDFFEAYPDEFNVNYDLSCENSGGVFPLNARSRCTWSADGAQSDAAGITTLTIRDTFASGRGQFSNTSDTPFGFALYKVKDTAPTGKAVDFHFTSETGAETMYTDNSGHTYTFNEINSVKFEVSEEASTDTTLKELKVSSGGTDYILTPSFTVGSNVVEYSTVVPSDITSIDIQATPTDAGATILAGASANQGIGSKNLTTGDNTFEFTVQAESGATEIYTVNVKKLNNNAQLETLSLSGITFTFSKETDEYNLTVPYKTSSTTVSATLPSNTNATIDSGTGSWNLDTGINTKAVVVKAEDCGYTTEQVPGVSCTTSSYTLNVTRSDPSNDAALKDLNVDGALITGFDPSVLEYTLTPAGKDKTSINITATSNETNAKVTGTGSKTLNAGDNQFIVTVVAEDGITKKEYKINIKKLSSEAKLASLSVTSTPQGTMEDFSPTNFFYEYYYDETVTTIDVSATASGNATITGGTGTFTVGESGATTVSLTAEDGTVVNYNIKFVKKLSSEKGLKSITVSNGSDTYEVTPTVSDSETTYNVEIPHEVTSVKVEAKAKSAYATVKEGDGIIDNIEFTTIERIITIKAEDDTTADYTLNITRKKSDNASLTDITVNGESITGFNKETLSYTLDDVKGNVDRLTIGFTKENTYADVVVTGDTLTDGENQIKLTVTSQDESMTNVYILNVNRKSNKADLASLSVTSTPQGTLSPNFSKDKIVYTYTYDEEATSIDVTATPEGSATIKSGTGSYDPSTTTKAEIVVEAEDETTKTYTINFSKSVSSNAKLKSITVSNGSDTYAVTPNVSDTQKTYNVEIPHEVTSVTVTATAQSGSADVTSGNGTENNIGFNPVNRSIVITAEDGVTKESYTLTITRKKSNNADLTGITIDGTPLSGFDKDTLEYTLPAVDNTVSSLSIDYTKASEYADDSIVAGTNNLVAGDNTVIIRIVSQDGSKTKEYKLKVRKKSNDTTLSGLTITSDPQGSYTPTFNALTKEYIYKYDRTVTSVVVNATATSGLVTSGNGTYNIPDTKEVTIEVTAQDENFTDTYKIKFEQILENDSTLKTLNIKNGEETYTLTPTFDPSRKNYTLTVEGDVEEVEIEALANGEHVKGVEGTGKTSLVSGSNIKIVKVTAEDNTTTTYTVVITRKINTKATLTELKINDELIETPFNPETANYSLIVPYDTTSINIKATPITGATLTGDLGDQSLSVGDNTLTITVTAEDNTTKGNYTIDVRRKSNDFSLSNLNVTSSPASTVKKDINGDFIIDIPSGVNQISISPVTTDTNAKVTNLSSLSNIDVTGKATVDIDVMAEDNLYYTTYTVKLNKLLSTNVYLSSLTVNHGTLTPRFDKETDSYKVEVGREVENITITAVAEDTKSTVTGDGTESLTPGDNPFTITVTAEDASKTKDYVVVVTRKQKNILTLSDLKIDGTTIDDFSSEKISYTIKVPYSKKDIKIEATTTDVDAKITGTGIGTHNLTGNREVFSFLVTAEDGSTQTYEVTVEKEAPDTDNTLTDLSVVGYPLTPGFSSSTENYNIGNIPLAVESLEINATTRSNKSTITYKVNGREISKTDNKLVIPSDLGPATIEVIVTSEDGQDKTYTIHYNKTDGSLGGLDKITSVKMADGITDMHDISDEFILTGRPEVTWNDFKAEFLNEQAELFLYNNDGKAESTAQYIRTGDMIKLIRDGEVLDTKFIVIKGDANGDGFVNISDASRVATHDREVNMLEGAYLKAGDANLDGATNISDASRLATHDREDKLLTWGKGSN